MRSLFLPSPLPTTVALLGQMALRFTDSSYEDPKKLGNWQMETLHFWGVLG